MALRGKMETFFFAMSLKFTFNYTRVAVFFSLPLSYWFFFFKAWRKPSNSIRKLLIITSVLDCCAAQASVGGASRVTKTACVTANHEVPRTGNMDGTGKVSGFSRQDREQTPLHHSAPDSSSSACNDQLSEFSSQTANTETSAKQAVWGDIRALSPPFSCPSYLPEKVHCLFCESKVCGWDPWSVFFCGLLVSKNESNQTLLGCLLCTSPTSNNGNWWGGRGKLKTNHPKRLADNTNSKYVSFKAKY